MSAVAPTITLAGNNDTLALRPQDGIIMLEGLDGFDMPPVDAVISAPAGWDGGFVENVRFGIREVFIPLSLFAETQLGFRALRTRIANLVSPKRGDVVIDVAREDKTRRLIKGRYVSGFDQPLTSADGLLHQTTGLLFRCSDPLWRSPVSAPLQFDPARGGQIKPFLDDPFFDVVLTPSIANRGKAFTIHNPGFEESYPIVTVHGPGDNIVVNCNGQQFALNHVAAGETIQIDARRGRQSVTDQADNSAWDRFIPGSVLWPILVGDNHLVISFSNGDAHSNVVVRYESKHLTAW